MPSSPLKKISDDLTFNPPKFVGLGFPTSPMAPELKVLNSGAPTATTAAATAADKDSRPLLKPDPDSSESISEMEKKYAAYVRRDVYGTMGRGDLPLPEKIVLGFAMVTLVPIRLVVGILILVVYYLICRFCTLFSAPNREDGQEDYAHMGGWRRAVVVKSGKFLARAMLFNFGFYWITETTREGLTLNEDCREQPDESDRPGLCAIMYLIWIFSTKCPQSFQVLWQRLPLIGLISKCLGCIFVQRESKTSDFKGVSDVITERIREANQGKDAPTMLLFPEGTTTNGDYLLPFKTGAFLAKVPVLPVILRYPYRRFSPAWDSISGVRHVFLLLCQFINHIEVTRLPVYYPSQQEKDDPKLYASNVRKMMAAEGNLILSDIGLPEKRVYHAALNGNSLPRVIHQKDD